MGCSVASSSVESEWSSVGDAGGSSDSCDFAAVFEWFWGGERPPSVQVWQVLQLRKKGIRPAVLRYQTLVGWPESPTPDWLRHTVNEKLIEREYT